MQQRSFGKQIWRLFVPLLVKGCMAFLVEFVVLSLYTAPYIPKLLETVDSWDVYMQKITELSVDFFAKYGTEISALSALAAIPVLVWMFKKDCRYEKMRADAQGQTVSDKKPAFWKYILVVGISVPFAVGMNNIVMLSNLAEISEAYQEASKILYTPALPVQIVCVGIIIPIMEELIFRGLLYKRIKELVPGNMAILWSAVFFGLYHGNMVQIIYGLLCGVLLAYLCEKFNSLKAPIFAHMAMNIMICVITEMDGFRWMFEQPIRMGVITVVCAAAASSMYVLIRENV